MEEDGKQVPWTGGSRGHDHLNQRCYYELRKLWQEGSLGGEGGHQLPLGGSPCFPPAWPGPLTLCPAAPLHRGPAALVASTAFAAVERA